MYKKGIRWIEYMKSVGLGKHEIRNMVLSTSSPSPQPLIILITIGNFQDHPVTLVILNMIITSQVLGHTNINKNAQQANNMNKLSMHEVTMNF